MSQKCTIIASSAHFKLQLLLLSLKMKQIRLKVLIFQSHFASFEALHLRNLTSLHANFPNSNLESYDNLVVEMFKMSKIS